MIWSGRGDLNSRPPAPKAGALPGCATPRLKFVFDFKPLPELATLSGLPQSAQNGPDRDKTGERYVNRIL